MNILRTRICLHLLEIATTFLTCLKLSFMSKHKIESKMIRSESESELDFRFAINSVSDFDSDSESDSGSDSSWAFINLDFVFFHPVFTLF